MTDVETFLTNLFGNHCGLNADFSCKAWRVGEGEQHGFSFGVFILDTEDDKGTYLTTIRTCSDESGESHWRDVGRTFRKKGEAAWQTVDNAIDLARLMGLRS